MKDKGQSDESKIKIALEYANSIITTLRESFLVLDKKLRVISSNQAFYTTFEVAEKDTIGKLLPDLGNRQWNIPSLMQLLKEIIPDKRVVKDYEVEHKFEQIGHRVMLLNACQLRVPKNMAAIIAAGAIEEEEEEEELILLAIEDITQRKRLQEELKDSEERFRRAFETAPDGLLLVDKTEGAILNSNSCAQALLDYSQEEFLKMKLWEIGVTKDAKDFQKMMSILERKGMIYFDDVSFDTPKGLSIRADVFLMDRAKVIQCNIRDMTEKKKSEEDIKSLSKFPSEDPNPVLRIAKDGKVLSSNPAGEVILQAWGTDIKGKVPADWIRTIEYVLQDNRQKEKVLETDSVTYSFVVAPVIESGYVNLYGRDITEQKKIYAELEKHRNHLEALVKERTIELEEEVKARKKGEEEIRRYAVQLQVANQELESFSYSVSHDLRAPLRSMDGFSRILLETCKDKLDDEEKDNLMRVRKASQRMAQLIEDILILSRVARKEIKKERVDLTRIGELILSNLKGKDPLRHVEGIIQPGLFGECDEFLIELVLENLLNNAWKFTSKTENTRIEFGKGSDGKENIFFIKDNGAGFEMKYSDKLFNAFQRLHSEKDFPGTGIGLASVKRIISRLGGRVWAESDVGKGATFYFTLP